MTYQGARARPADNEDKRVFAVSRVRLDAAGRVTEVLWGEINARSNQDVGAKTPASVAEVVDAIHDGAQVLAVFPDAPSHLPERLFEVVKHDDASVTIALADLPGRKPARLRELHDMAKLDASPAPVRERAQPKAKPRRARIDTFAVSKVGLDADGRVTSVLWGRVDTQANAWATPEVVAPVAEAVEALQAGDRVFALFPSVHGHLPDRQFVVVDYEDGRQTIVLDGSASFEREIHDMDRLIIPAIIPG